VPPAPPPSPSSLPPPHTAHSAQQPHCRANPPATRATAATRSADSPIGRPPGSPRPEAPRKRDHASVYRNAARRRGFIEFRKPSPENPSLSHSSGCGLWFSNLSCKREFKSPPESRAPHSTCPCLQSLSRSQVCCGAAVAALSPSSRRIGGNLSTIDNLSSWHARREPDRPSASRRFQRSTCADCLQSPVFAMRVFATTRPNGLKSVRNGFPAP